MLIIKYSSLINMIDVRLLSYNLRVSVPWFSNFQILSFRRVRPIKYFIFRFDFKPNGQSISLLFIVFEKSREHKIRKYLSQLYQDKLILINTFSLALTQFSYVV